MSFVALPPVPTSGLTEAEFQLLAAINQNLNVLTGQITTDYKAVISGQITLMEAPELQSTGLTSADSGAVASALQVLISDVQALRDTVNILIAQLRS